MGVGCQQGESSRILGADGSVGKMFTVQACEFPEFTLRARFGCMPAISAEAGRSLGLVGQTV